VRSADIVGRWGGEEFLGILTTCTAESMRAAGERARMLVEKSYLTIDQQQLGATISIGMAEALETDTPESLIKRADQSLYQSKTNGRNRVTVAGEVPAVGAAAGLTNTATAE
jgi:diguanylate cyclase (GGDEF)-like protein